MICTKVLLIGFLSVLTPVDKSVIKQSKKTCKREHNTCVKSITKKGNDTYYVICK
jgi:hypothetical protein